MGAKYSAKSCTKAPAVQKKWMDPNRREKLVLGCAKGNSCWSVLGSKGELESFRWGEGCVVTSTV